MPAGTGHLAAPAFDLGVSRGGSCATGATAADDDSHCPHDDHYAKGTHQLIILALTSRWMTPADASALYDLCSSGTSKRRVRF